MTNSIRVSKEEALVLQPTEWWLHNELQNSIAIRCFSTFASKIDLIVNVTTNQVIGLDVLNNGYSDYDVEIKCYCNSSERDTRSTMFSYENNFFLDGQ